jgi:hypothetical protein
MSHACVVQVLQERDGIVISIAKYSFQGINSKCRKFIMLLGRTGNHAFTDIRIGTNSFCYVGCKRNFNIYNLQLKVEAVHTETQPLLFRTLNEHDSVPVLLNIEVWRNR